MSDSDNPSNDEVANAGGFDSLRKLNGFTRTFVVHSNANPYAAVAAMSSMLARSQEEGNYFRTSDSFVPQVNTMSQAEVDSRADGKLLAIDLMRDWEEYLSRTALPSCGLLYNTQFTLDQNTMRFLNAKNRRIPKQGPRNVLESAELAIPPEYQLDYEKVVSAIRAGADLKPYLSRDVIKYRRPDKNDGLLNAWGIHHLHYRHEGAGELLFCMITESSVHMIQSVPHDAKHLWVDKQLLQIVHNNWPEQLDRGRARGLQPEEHDPGRRATLRRLNANFITTLEDGSVIIAPGGGVMASGDSQENRLHCDKILTELSNLQTFVIDNVDPIRNALDYGDGRSLMIRAAFNNNLYCFYEPTSAVRIALNPKQ